MTKLFLLAAAAIAACASASAGGSAFVDHREFRDLFFSALDERISEQELHKLLYVPNAELTDDRTSGRLLGLQAMARQLDPFELYQLGVSAPVHRGSARAVEEPFRQLERSTGSRLTIVVVPGIFGEFIKTRAFEEVLREDSDTRRNWLGAVADARQTSSALVTDRRFSLEAMGTIAEPIEDLLSVGSLNDRSGAPLADVVLFNTPLMSLESMGDISEKASIFLRRLNKYLRITRNSGGKLLFIGYSRGAMIALEMLSQARESKGNSWLRNVVGLVTVGGVVFGSDYADVATSDVSSAKPAQQIRLLRQIRQELKDIIPFPEGASIREKTAIAAENTKRLASNRIARLRFRAAMAKTLIEKADGSLPASGKEAKDMSAGAWRSLRLQKGANLLAVATTADEVLTKNFTLKAPVKDYNANLGRLRQLIDEALLGVSQLTTEARLEWWASHQIPTNVHYYAIVGTMVNSQSADAEERALSANSVAYNSEHPDFAQLTQGYLDYKELTGIAVNDSQVGAHKARFWPKLIRSLNRSQPPVRTSFLGVAGAHHWGLALETATQMQDGRVDPFPRKALLKSLAASSLIDLSRR